MRRLPKRWQRRGGNQVRIIFGVCCAAAVIATAFLMASAQGAWTFWVGVYLGAALAAITVALLGRQACIADSINLSSPGGADFLEVAGQALNQYRVDADTDEAFRSKLEGIATNKALVSLRFADQERVPLPGDFVSHESNRLVLYHTPTAGPGEKLRSAATVSEWAFREGSWHLQCVHIDPESLTVEESTVVHGSSRSPAIL